jgi:hypothetical protein
MNTATPATKEMEMNLSQIAPVAASSAGSLSGFECKCTCGMVLRSSLRTILEQDAAAHLAYHARKGA